MLLVMNAFAAKLNAILFGLVSN